MRFSNRADDLVFFHPSHILVQQQRSQLPWGDRAGEAIERGGVNVLGDGAMAVRDTHRVRARSKHHDVLARQTVIGRLGVNGARQTEPDRGHDC